MATIRTRIGATNRPRARAGLVDAGRAGDTPLPLGVARAQAERRQLDWARWEFRSRVEGRLRDQGVDWPAVEVDEWGAAHYRLPPVPTRASWWRRLLYGPRGARRERTV